METHLYTNFQSDNPYICAPFSRTVTITVFGELLEAKYTKGQSDSKVLMSTTRTIGNTE